MSALITAAAIIALVAGLCALIVKVADQEAQDRARHRAQKWAA